MNGSWGLELCTTALNEASPVRHGLARQCGEAHIATACGSPVDLKRGLISVSFAKYQSESMIKTQNIQNNLTASRRGTNSRCPMPKSSKTRQAQSVTRPPSGTTSSSFFTGGGEGGSPGSPFSRSRMQEGSSLLVPLAWLGLARVKNTLQSHWELGSNSSPSWAVHRVSSISSNPSALRQSVFSNVKCQQKKAYDKYRGDFIFSWKKNLESQTTVFFGLKTRVSVHLKMSWSLLKKKTEVWWIPCVGISEV